MLVTMDEIIDGARFIGLADHQYNRLNDKTVYPIPKYTHPISIYCHNELVNHLFDDIKKRPPFVLISHNGDGKVTTCPNQHDADVRKIPDNLIHWFGHNVHVAHPKITCIPGGLENSCWSTNKQSDIINIQSSPKNILNLCYMNFNIDTNPLIAGNNKNPIDSAISPNIFFSCCIAPPIVFVSATAAPPNNFVIFSTAVVILSVEPTAPVTCIPYLVNAFVELPTDFATRSPAEARVIPLAAARSRVAFVSLSSISPSIPKLVSCF